MNSLSVTKWPLTDVSKSTFIKHGYAPPPPSLPFHHHYITGRWCRTLGGSPAECEVPSKQCASAEVALSPPEQLSGDGKWLHVDGEEYEVLPMHIMLRPDHLTLYSPHPIT